jgi:hypothetical protein
VKGENNPKNVRRTPTVLVSNRAQNKKKAPAICWNTYVQQKKGFSGARQFIHLRPCQTAKTKKPTYTHIQTDMLPPTNSLNSFLFLTFVRRMMAKFMKNI